MENKIENYLTLAQTALDGNNYIECENYVNKVLEIDSINTDAYLLKIKSLLIKQRFGYNEEEQNISKNDFISNIEKQKCSCYSIMIKQCVFFEEHIQIVTGFVMDDFFSGVYRYQNLYSKPLSTDLFIHIIKKVNNSSDDEIVQAFLGLYERAKNDDEFAAKTFLRACSKNQEYKFASNDVAESFYRELIRIEIYDLLDTFSEIDFTIKEILHDINLIKDNDEFYDIKENIDAIRIYVTNIKSFNPSYNIYDDEIIELNEILKFLVKAGYREHAISAYNKIKKIKPDYSVDSNLEASIKSFQSPTKQGCYIATCVYGTYDCPEVWVLRRFRDYTLYKSSCGRLFIKTYYAISPKLVKLFGDTKWFKNCCKHILNNLITKLRIKGYKDSKYTDRY